MNEVQIFASLGYVFSLLLVLAGLTIRKFGFPVVTRPLFVKGEGDGIYIRWFFKNKKVLDDTPENRIKYSKFIGNFFIVLSSIFFITCLFIYITGVNR